MKKRNNTSDQKERLLQDILITLLIASGAKRDEVRRVVGVDVYRVYNIMKAVNSGKKSK